MTDGAYATGFEIGELSRTARVAAAAPFGKLDAAVAERTPLA